MRSSSPVGPLRFKTPDHKSTSPLVGGIYVIRIDGVAIGNQSVRRGGTAYFKIRILEFVPDERVKIRWAML